MSKIKFVGIILIFIIILIGGRLLWLESFKPSKQPYAMDGVLDLQDWQPESGQTITLDGEWEFYPYLLLMSDQDVPADLENHSQIAQIPGNWNTLLHPQKPSAYGYGSYRLRVMLPPDSEHTFSIYVTSIRSASQLYVDGKKVGSSGQPTPHAEGFIAKNIPYSATFSASGSHMLEIVIQAANYSDPRSGGLIRSLKFGLESAVTKEKQLSMAMQILITAAMMIQAIYLLILFSIERNKQWLLFPVLLLSFIIIILNSNDDKLLMQWLPINQLWSFKLLNLSFIALLYSLFEYLAIQFSEALRVRLLYLYRSLGFIAICAVIMLPMPFQIMLQISAGILFILPIIIALMKILRYVLQGHQNSLWLTLAFLACSNQILWWIIHMSMGVKVIFYPFDMLLALISFSSIWVKRYWTALHEQKELTAKLQMINKSQDEFLANTSHELRNPLHGIINISQVVLDRERDAIHHKSVRELETVLSVSRRMSLMLDDLLDITRLKNHNIRLQLTGVCLYSVVSGVMDMIRFMAIGKPIRLSNRVSAHFPKVHADENRLTQVLFNLLHNAVKYTEEGEVSVHAYTENGLAYIVVSDTGIGIEEQWLEQVFEPYEQAAPMDRRIEGGLGLGLSISKHIIALHGGSIRVQSSPGKGSQFTFHLPLDDGTSTAENLNGEAAIVEAAAVSSDNRLTPDLNISGHSFTGDKSRILAVDDDAVNLRILESILSDEHYDITSTLNGKEALELIQTQEWDLVITDIMMPHMSGYELSREIRKTYAVSELPILLLTARSRMEDIEQGFNSGANDFVTKPVEARELRSRVWALTQLKKSVRESIRLETAWLQAQIEPHFFFNTLNSIAALQASDPDKMMELIHHFSDFLRSKFRIQNSDDLIPLKKELDLVRSYLYIEKTRLGDKLQVEWELDDTEDLLIPPYTIQPLVENSIQHGISKRAKVGIIKIILVLRKHDAEIIVSDNGVGMDPEQLQQLVDGRFNHQSGIGMRNVDLRLKRIYGAGLQLSSHRSVGTTVSFVIMRQHGV